MNDFYDIKKLGMLKRTVSMNNPIGSHHYIVLNYLYGWMEQVAVKYAHGRLLDYGCGGQTYRTLLEAEAQIKQYVGADVAASPGILLDVEIIPDKPLGIADESVDTVLSNQVLEHVPEPNFYLADVYRVLKKDGVLILTAPMQWRHHEVPFDYNRFTKYGLTYLLEKHGFAIERIDPCGGVFALIGQIFCSYLAENGITYRAGVYSTINRFVLWLDQKYPDYEDSLAWMCIAKKQEPLK